MSKVLAMKVEDHLHQLTVRKHGLLGGGSRILLLLPFLFSLFFSLSLLSPTNDAALVKWLKAKNTLSVYGHAEIWTCEAQRGCVSLKRASGWRQKHFLLLWLWDKTVIFPLLSWIISLFLYIILLLLCCAVNLLAEDVDVISVMAQWCHGDMGVGTGWMEVYKIKQNNKLDIYPGHRGLNVPSSVTRNKLICHHMQVMLYCRSTWTLLITGFCNSRRVSCTSRWV